jgi:NAD(P)-dependent dehydrogenase (short-subunit alcohol dehydrogenase family)
VTTALVTGGSGGLGTAICAALAAAGHDVAVHYRTDRPGAEAAAAAVRAHGRRALAVPADFDVADPDELDACCARVLDEAAALGPLRVVVLAAAGQTPTDWNDLDAACWDRVYRQGLRPTAVLIRQAGQRLPAGGCIVTIGSIEAMRAAPGHAPYASLKAGVQHLTAAAAHELGPRGVRVVCVAPGLVERPGLGAQWPEGLTRWRAAAALGRPVTAAEVASVVTFLTGDGASAVTGVSIPVDAGWSSAPGW